MAEKTTATIPTLQVESQSKSFLAWPDYLAIGVYIVFILAVGFESTRRSKSGLSGYFLASRSMHWIPVGASIFASNIGSQLFLGLAGTGAASGVAVAGFELNAIYILVMLGWLFVPVYLSAGVYTMPEYLRLRFGGQRIRMYLGVLSLLLYIFTKISGDLFAGALFIQKAVGETSPRVLYTSVVILLLIAGVFTLMGGLTAVMWTDFVQTILIILGAFVLMIIAYVRVGGEQKIRERFPYAMPKKLAYDANNQTCGLVTPYALNLMRPADDPDLPWTGTTIGLTIIATWFWCTDQVMVQRTLTSRNLTHAKAGCILASWLKILPLWILVFPGMIARILFPDEVACVDPKECEKICNNPAGCTNIAFIKLVLELMPVGLRGSMLAVMMAALMSSLTSVFNSASTIFTIDIWTCLRKKSWKNKSAKEVELEQLIVGRISVFLLIVISVLWIPAIQRFSNSQLFVYMQSITSFLAPPITAVFILAVFHKRTNEPGAFWGLMVGLLVGLIRFIMEFSYFVPPCGSDIPDTRPEFIILLVDPVNFLNFGIILFFITLIVTLSVSYMTPPIPDICLHRLTFATRHSQEPRVSISEYEKHEDNEIVMQKHNTAERDLSQCSKFMASIFCLRKELSNSDSSGREEEILTHQQQMERMREFMDEKPSHKLMVNISAVISMMAVTFVYGFYS